EGCRISAVVVPGFVPDARGLWMDWLLRKLADWMGVEPAQAGEAITPRIRAEQPLSQGWAIFAVVACVTLIVWLYRHEGRASSAYKMLLAGLRISLVLLALF